LKRGKTAKKALEKTKRERKQHLPRGMSTGDETRCKPPPTKTKERYRVWNWGKSE